MKTMKLFIAITLFITGSISMELTAQENINTLVKKCETLESVTISVVKNKNKETKIISKIITGIKINSNPELVKEFFNAFQKDQENADQISEEKKAGKINNLFYRFGNSSYSMDINKQSDGAEIYITEYNK